MSKYLGGTTDFALAGGVPSLPSMSRFSCSLTKGPIMRGDSHTHGPGFATCRAATATVGAIFAGLIAPSVPASAVPQKGKAKQQFEKLFQAAAQ